MTMRMIDRAKAHFKQLSDAPRTIEIPEWQQEGEEEVPVVYYTPMTLKQKDTVSSFSKKGNEYAAEICILKCKDENGDPVFNRGDKQSLMRSADFKIIERIANEIIGEGDSDDAFEEMEKN